MNLFFILIVSAIFMVLYIIVPPFKMLEGLLEINNTLLIQFPVFLISLYVLNKLMFQPLLTVWDRRESLTEGTVKEAKKLTDEADSIIAEYENKLDEAREQANEQRAELRREGQVEAEKMISSARTDAQKQIENHRDKLESEIKEVKSQIEPQIELLAKDISNRILNGEARA